VGSELFIRARPEATGEHPGRDRGPRRERRGGPQVHERSQRASLRGGACWAAGADRNPKGFTPVADAADAFVDERGDASRHLESSTPKTARRTAPGRGRSARPALYRQLLGSVDCERQDFHADIHGEAGSAKSRLNIRYRLRPISSASPHTLSARRPRKTRRGDTDRIRSRSSRARCATSRA
jgi:hypothetical protein